MGDLSNKTLALLVGVAIVVSLVGLLSAPKGAVITGGATTGTGTAQVDITAGTASITITDQNINFSSGYVNVSAPFATLNSSLAFPAGASNWINTSTPWSVDYLLVENDGTAPVSLTVNSSKTAAGMIGGTSPDFQIGFEENEAGSCDGTLAGWFTASATQTDVCTGTSGAGFVPTDTNDTIRMYAYLEIPRDALPGAKSATLTFVATANQQ